MAVGALRGDANPFDVRPGAVPPAFGGREAVLAELATGQTRIRAGRPGPILVVEALRGYGKTALLTHAVGSDPSSDATPIVGVKRDIAVGDANLVVALDRATAQIRRGERLERVTGVKLGPLEVTRAPTVDGGPDDLAELAAELAQAAADHDQPVVLAIDEAHEHPAVAIAILRGLQWVDRAPVACYFAGLPGTRDQLANVITWAERIPVTTLSLLDRDEVGDALVPPFHDYDIQIAPDVIDQVTTVSGGYPYFVALWGHHLWNQTPTDVIDAAAVAAATDHVRATVESLYRGRWERITPTQRTYAHALARLGGTATSSDVADAIDRDITTASPLRAELIARGMIHAPQRGQVAFTIPGLATWITATIQP